MPESSAAVKPKRVHDAPTRIRALKGADLLGLWLRGPRSHARGVSCLVCDGDMQRCAITLIVYTFEVCKCDSAPYAHIFEQLWHRKCFMAHSSAVMGL